jgi:8-oxo-dGTP pyrophosphatase MutT (NUDIX family)
MKRRAVLEALEEYVRSGAEEALVDAEEQRATALRIAAFVREHEDCLERTCPPGHLTGSGLVVTDAFDRVLLTLHRKLGRWLQLGGHADGEPHLHEVALREAREESGLADVTLVPLGPGERPAIHDVDVHWIPARGETPGHWHLDLRFLMRTSDPDRIVASEESHELRWFPLEEAYRVTDERSMHRQLDKVRALRERRGS